MLASYTTAACAVKFWTFLISEIMFKIVFGRDTDEILYFLEYFFESEVIQATVIMELSVWYKSSLKQYIFYL